MRLQKLTLVGMAVAAGISLTACQGSDTASGSTGGSSGGTTGGSSAAQSTGGDKASAEQSGSGSDTTTDAAPAGGTGGTDACATSQLGFSSSHGMGEGTLLVNLKNTGSQDCTLQGFPGVDLKSKNGSVSVNRSKLGAPKVTVAPGDETRFTLHYQPNTSGGSGETFTSMVVTPPNETHSHTLPVSINVPVSDSSVSSLKVDPVGTGK